MKTVFSLILISTLALLAQEEEDTDPNEAANTIILDELSVKNLGIELEEAIETDFEETIFAIGRIDDIPTNHVAVSSRISGRALAVNAIEGDHVSKDQVLVQVESRQPRLPGRDPSIIPLSAPISGTVLESHVRPGEPVEPENKLFDIVDLSDVWAIARVPEQEAGRIKIGSKARIRVAALSGEKFDGELVRFGTRADIASGTLDAIFLLKNAELHLRPGMRAEFSIITSSRPDVLAVPREAVQGDPANRVVYVEHFDLPNAYIKTPVQIGAQNDKFLEIVAGLFPADRVVTTGSYFLGSAGGGGISLKEALDAAHGHEHNEDGSLMSEEQKAAQDAAKGIAPKEAKFSGPLTLFLAITSGIFLFLLVMSGIKHLRDGKALAAALNSLISAAPQAPPIPENPLPQSSGPASDA